MSDDEQLQRDVENKVTTSDSVDAKAYQKIFAALEKEQYELPFGFADRVMRRIEVKEKGISKDVLWMGAGIAFLAIAFVVTAVWLKFAFNFGAFKFISGYGGSIVFGTLLILGFQWADKAIIQKRFNSGH